MCVACCLKPSDRAVVAFQNGQFAGDAVLLHVSARFVVVIACLVVVLVMAPGSLHQHHSSSIAAFSGGNNLRQYY